MSRLHRGRKLLQSRLFDYVAHRHLVGRAALRQRRNKSSRCLTEGLCPQRGDEAFLQPIQHTVEIMISAGNHDQPR